MPDYSHDDLLTECRVYHEGIALFNSGQFFEAHEAWEEIWNLTLNRRRERFYRAIIQSAVTLELLRGRAVGVRQVFCSCLELFEGLPAVFMGLNIPGHISNLRGAIAPTLEDLETRFIQVDPARLFQIELIYDPFRESRHGEDAELPQ